MAKNVELMGAVFPDCPAVMLPTHEGPLARFTDVSDSQAVAADVAQGKAFYLADGTKTTGTNQGGGGGGGGGGTIKPNARLVLIDYDGSIVDSYTRSEVDALSALPANPDHSGDEIPLTSQGWNWTLAEVREQLTAMPEQTVYVGNVVIPSDGKTHIVIEIPEDAPENRRVATVRWDQTVSNGVTVDWGDGSATETYSSIGGADHDHTYATGGKRHITLEVTSGQMNFGGGTNMGISGNGASTTYQYKAARFRKIHIGNTGNIASIGSYAFEYCKSTEVITIPEEHTAVANRAFTGCTSLESITLPTGIRSSNEFVFENCSSIKTISVPAGITSLGNGLYYGCSNLKDVTIPKNVTNMGTQLFANCGKLKRAELPNGIVTVSANMFNGCGGLQEVILAPTTKYISDYAFSYCNTLGSIIAPGEILSVTTTAYRGCASLTIITIPEGVTSIASNSFNGCAAVSEYHFKRTTPPSLANKNAFTGIASDCVIYVPYSADHSILQAYKTASNWSNYASKIVEEAA